MFLVVSAVTSGLTTWEEIVDFGEEKLARLRKYLAYESGIPSHDTVNRVMSIINYRTFEQCFINWATMDISLPSGAVISVDGKKIRGSATKKEQQTAHADGGKLAKHIVHAWCSELQICLGQRRVSSKSNEITAIRSFGPSETARLCCDNRRHRLPEKNNGKNHLRASRLFHRGERQSRSIGAGHFPPCLVFPSRRACVF
ncbi:MAG: ISAs1 family transposase [Saprospiraceae bacterium]|nr:ISAs1 family transposase [Saprospiraceae bacterium]